MKPLVEEIQEILSPRDTIGLVEQNKIYQLQSIMPLTMLLESAEEFDEMGQDFVLKFLHEKTTVIHNGIVYIATKGLNFEGRLKEILTVYNNHVRNIIGDKKALIDLYDKIPLEDIANLTEDHVIFVLKKLARHEEKALAAMRYLDDYEIHYESNIWQMPGCSICVHIDNNLNIGNPEVITKDFKYEHPFVYRDIANFGQKICMGTFYKSTAEKQFNKLRFANNINSLLKQAVQILVSGYNRGVMPANGHLTEKRYEKFIIGGK